jgi:hypothetical protein
MSKRNPPHINTPRTRSATILRGSATLALALGVCAGLRIPSALANTDGPLPPDYSAAACYGLVQDAGRAIAWARWEERQSWDKTRATPFPAQTPAWASELVQGWIADAYQWRVTDDQIRQWAAELGSVDNLPSAQTLSVHETIAIWLRRIARRCNERNGHAEAAARGLAVARQPDR